MSDSKPEDGPAPQAAAFARAFNEFARAFNEFARAFNEFARSFNDALVHASEQLRPVVEELIKIANRPEVLAAFAAIDEAQSSGPYRRPCYCFCQRMHPAEVNVCDMIAVTARQFVTKQVGPVDVALCAPCAVAQGVAEMADSPGS
jgi:hypothetical protein